MYRFVSVEVLDGVGWVVLRRVERLNALNSEMVEEVMRALDELDGRIVERDVVGAINIGLKYLSSDGSPMALGSTGAHEVWVKQVNPHQGPTPLTGIPLAGKRSIGL